MQISMFYISACETAIDLKFWGSFSWAPIILQTKFQVSSSLGTYISKTQIWPKSAVNWVLYVNRLGKVFFLYLDLTWGLCRAVFGPPYRFASLLIYIYILLRKTTAVQNEDALSYYRVRGLYFLAVAFVTNIDIIGVFISRAKTCVFLLFENLWLIVFKMFW